MVKYCKNCGLELKDDAKFCSACGTKVEVEAQPTPEPEPQPVVTPPPAQPLPPQPVAPTYPPVKKSPVGLIIALVVVLVVIIAVVLVVVFMFVGGTSSSGDLVGTWDVQDVAGLTDSDWTFYQNGSLKKVTTYEYGYDIYTYWTTWVFSNNRLEIEDELVSYTCEFKNGGNTVDLKYDYGYGGGAVTFYTLNKI